MDPSFCGLKAKIGGARGRRWPTTRNWHAVAEMTFALDPVGPTSTWIARIGRPGRSGREDRLIRLPRGRSVLADCRSRDGSVGRRVFKGERARAALPRRCGPFPPGQSLLAHEVVAKRARHVSGHSRAGDGTASGHGNGSASLAAAIGLEQLADTLPPRRDIDLEICPISTTRILRARAIARPPPRYFARHELSGEARSRPRSGHTVQRCRCGRRYGPEAGGTFSQALFCDLVSSTELSGPTTRICANIEPLSRCDDRGRPVMAYVANYLGDGILTISLARGRKRKEAARRPRRARGGRCSQGVSLCTRRDCLRHRRRRGIEGAGRRRAGAIAGEPGAARLEALAGPDQRGSAGPAGCLWAPSSRRLVRAEALTAGSGGAFVFRRRWPLRRPREAHPVRVGREHEVALLSTGSSAQPRARPSCATVGRGGHRQVADRPAAARAVSDVATAFGSNARRRIPRVLCTRSSPSRTCCELLG
jgi:hypothetical protein